MTMQSDPDQLNAGSGNQTAGTWQQLADSDLPQTLSPENQEAEAQGVVINIGIRES